MADKLIITYEEYKKVVEKLALEIEKKYKPTVLVLSLIHISEPTRPY